MAGKVLLDTNVVIAFFSGESAVTQHFTDAEVFVSSTVLGELHYGARKSVNASGNLAKIEQFAASVQVLSCDAATAQIYGTIKDQAEIKRPANSRKRHLDCCHRPPARIVISHAR